jgi:hypothetical protein
VTNWDAWTVFVVHGLTSAMLGLLTGTASIALIDRVLFRNFDTAEEIKHGNWCVAAVYIAAIISSAGFAVCVRW